MQENSSKVIQNFINNHKKGFNPFILNPKNAYEIATTKIILKNGKEVLNENGDIICHLASTSKVFIAKLLIDVLVEKGLTPEFKVNAEFVRELLAKKQYHRIQEIELYKPLVQFIERNTKKQNVKNFLKAKLKDGFLLDSIDWSREEVPKIYIDTNELLFNMLTLSSNGATEMAKEKLVEILGSKNAVRNYLEDKKIAPGFELHLDVSDIWYSEKPNGGNLLEMLRAFDKLSKELSKDLAYEDEVPMQREYRRLLYKEMLSAIKNNVTYKRGGITQFLAQQNKLTDNIGIVEKAGTMWPVVFGNKYAEYGYPPFMVLGTIFTIYKNGERYSCLFFKTVAIAIPKTLDIEGFPNINEKNYKHYIFLVENKYRTKLFKEIIRSLNKAEIIENLKFKTKFSVKSSVKKYYAKNALRSRK